MWIGIALERMRLVTTLPGGSSWSVGTTVRLGDLTFSWVDERVHTWAPGTLRHEWSVPADAPTERWETAAAQVGVSMQHGNEASHGLDH